MKSKWAAVITLFILSVISCFYLYKNTIRDLNEYYKDKKIDSIVMEIDSLEKEYSKIDIANFKAIRVANNVCTRLGEYKDSMPQNTEKCQIDSVKNIISKIQVSHSKVIDKLKKNLRSSHKTTSKNKSTSKLSIITIILSIITYILVTIFIVLVIKFSGILQLLKTKIKNMKNKRVDLTKGASKRVDDNGSSDKTVKQVESQIKDEVKNTTDKSDYVDSTDTQIGGAETEEHHDIKEELSDEAKKRIRKFTNQPNTIGISFQGDNHLKATPEVPCQDYHFFKKVNDVWNIAIVSDGAGSKTHSDEGSNAVCLVFNALLTQMLQNDKRFVNGDIPNEKIWDLEFRSLLNQFQLILNSNERFRPYEFDSLAATIIILAYSPKGYMFAHVGDGRAGVKINGEWKTILTPHKGEEANQTIFSTTIDFAKKPSLMMSGVFIPETKVEATTIEAFVLMSDGCENGAWVTYQKINLPDGDFRIKDVNLPRSQTIEELMSIIDALDNEQQVKLVNFITSHNKGFKTEGDDKTILIGKIK